MIRVINISVFERKPKYFIKHFYVKTNGVVLSLSKNIYLNVKNVELIFTHVFWRQIMSSWNFISHVFLW